MLSRSSLCWNCCAAFSGLWSLWMSWHAAACPHTSHETPSASPTRERALWRQVHVWCLCVPIVSIGVDIVCSSKWTKRPSQKSDPHQWRRHWHKSAEQRDFPFSVSFTRDDVFNAQGSLPVLFMVIRQVQALLGFRCNHRSHRPRVSTCRPASLLAPCLSVPPSWGPIRPSLSKEELSIPPSPTSFVSASEEGTWDIPSRTGRT